MKIAAKGLQSHKQQGSSAMKSSKCFLEVGWDFQVVKKQKGSTATVRAASLLRDNVGASKVQKILNSFFLAKVELI